MSKATPATFSVPVQVDRAAPRSWPDLAVRISHDAAARCACIEATATDDRYVERRERCWVCRADATGGFRRQVDLALPCDDQRDIGMDVPAAADVAKAPIAALSASLIDASAEILSIADFRGSGFSHSVPRL